MLTDFQISFQSILDSEDRSQQSDQGKVVRDKA